MARVALCDRCGAVIKGQIVKQISFAWNPSRVTVYDVCDKCYDRFEKCMKTKEEDTIIELAIGARFYYEGKFCEVTETEIDFRCEKCVFEADIDTCGKTECLAKERHDGKSVCFKEANE